ncbi:alpha/beta hydrolase [Formosa algae]|uniref:S-formylglutathione hydrolase FrmB n=1 Tax=Formosa algae TaxID=225843 RepID=A0A9X0YQ89_9FLAO|nr:alpha/beta hydrolase family protein [Formosa algae]MBP1841236.1 S-formylglutathione hydrolase FrmB [Formosa algae]MDQ0336841.1 S-formylglutathione hydrolase FrmB [Formosa algae]OEI81556.1 XynC protein [Formosa algae]
MTKKIICILILFLSCKGFASRVDTLLVHSHAMNKEVKNVVIIPDNYSKTNTAYNVVYLLHGAGGDYKAWLGKAPAIKKYADDYNIIIVCPDGDKTSWYFDSPIDASMKYETYVSDELITKIDQTYNTTASKSGRAISGYSMGGHGALYLAFKHQDIWGAVASMSGGVDIRPFPLRWDIAKRLGTYAENKAHWEQNTVINLVYLLDGKQLNILFDCGVDDFFYDANLRLHNKLKARNIPHDFISRPGGHTNTYWSNSIQYHMLFFNDFFKNSKN